MPEFCTCGAQLPPDALFCHKCGKPQREDLLTVEEEQPAPPPALPAAPPEPPPISLRNRHAVLVSLFACIASLVVSTVAGPLSVVVLAASGFLAVFLYRRLTGQSVSVLNGVKLGWITGVFIFVAALLMLSIGLATQPEMMDELRKNLMERLSEEQRSQGEELLQGPTMIGLLVFSTFVSSTLLAIAGGALGAKLLGGSGRTPHQPHA